LLYRASQGDFLERRIDIDLGVDATVFGQGNDNNGRGGRAGADELGHAVDAFLELLETGNGDDSFGIMLLYISEGHRPPRGNADPLVSQVKGLPAELIDLAAGIAFYAVDAPVIDFSPAPGTAAQAVRYEKDSPGWGDARQRLLVLRGIIFNANHILCNGM